MFGSAYRLELLRAKRGTAPGGHKAHALAVGGVAFGANRHLHAFGTGRKDLDAVGVHQRGNGLEPAFVLGPQVLIALLDSLVDFLRLLLDILDGLRRIVHGLAYLLREVRIARILRLDNHGRLALAEGDKLLRVNRDFLAVLFHHHLARVERTERLPAVGHADGAVRTADRCGHGPGLELELALLAGLLLRVEAQQALLDIDFGNLRILDEQHLRKLDKRVLLDRNRAALGHRDEHAGFHIRLDEVLVLDLCAYAQASPVAITLLLERDVAKNRTYLGALRGSHREGDRQNHPNR